MLKDNWTLPLPKPPCGAIPAVVDAQVPVPMPLLLRDQEVSGKSSKPPLLMGIVNVQTGAALVLGMLLVYRFDEK